MARNNKTDTEIRQDKTERIMNIIDERCGYYRANPLQVISKDTDMGNDAL
jgi:hypothetical protein